MFTPLHAIHDGKYNDKFKIAFTLNRPSCQKCEDFIGGLTKFLFQQSPDPARLRLWQEREREESEREGEELAENEKLSYFQWWSLTGLWKWIEQPSEIYIERGKERNHRGERGRIGIVQKGNRRRRRKRRWCPMPYLLTATPSSPTRWHTVKT